MHLGRPKSPIQWCIWADPNLQFSDAFGLTQISKSVIQLGPPKSPVQWRSWVGLNLQFSHTTLKYYLVVCWLALFLAYHRNELCPLSASYTLRFQHPYNVFLSLISKRGRFDFIVPVNSGPMILGGFIMGLVPSLITRLQEMEECLFASEIRMCTGRICPGAVPFITERLWIDAIIQLVMYKG